MTSKSQFTVLENRKSKKNGPSGAPGPLHFSIFLSQLKGGPFVEKNKFSKKVSQCRKTERRDPLGFSNIHSVAKHRKIEGEIFFSDKKSHSAEKTERWDPLRFFNIHSDAKQQKN